MKFRYWLLLAAVPLLTACPGPKSPVDEQRLSVLRAEPLASKISNPDAVAGFQISKKDAPRRSYVNGPLSEETREDAVTAAQKNVAEAASELAKNQWTVYFAVCVPPGSPSTEPESNPVIPRSTKGNWMFSAYAYKVIDGISYFAEVSGAGLGHGKTFVYLRLVAPYSTEAPNLFKDKPPAIAVASTCLAAAALPAEVAQTGTPTIMDDDAPEPDGSPKPAGHR